MSVRGPRGYRARVWHLRGTRYARRVEFVYLRYLVWLLPPRRGGTRRPPYLRRKYGGTRARATVADFGSFRVRGTGTRYVSAAGMPYYTMVCMVALLPSSTHRPWYCCCCLHLLEDGGRGRPSTPCTLPSQSTFTQSHAWLAYTGRTTRTMGARRRRFANVCSRAPRHRRCSPSPGSPQLAPVRLPLPPSPLDMAPAIAACAVVAAHRRPASAPTLL